MFHCKRKLDERMSKGRSKITFRIVIMTFPLYRIGAYRAQKHILGALIENGGWEMRGRSATKLEQRTQQSTVLKLYLNPVQMLTIECTLYCVCVCVVCGLYVCTRYFKISHTTLSLLACARSSPIQSLFTNCRITFACISTS